MTSPIPNKQLDCRIQDFLQRKDARFPEMNLLDRQDSFPKEDSPDRGENVWFRVLNPFN